jgi:hypothetical protein
MIEDLLLLPWRVVWFALPFVIVIGFARLICR